MVARLYPIKQFLQVIFLFVFLYLNYFPHVKIFISKIVFLAAHCVLRPNRKLNSSEVNVLLGVHNLSVTHETNRITEEVERIHVHDDWNPLTTSYDADIAILILKTEVEYSSYINPVCLMQPNKSISNITLGTVVGFGKSENREREDIAREAKFPIHSHTDCVTKFPELQPISAQRTICGGYANGTGACTGDSGSALTVVKDNRHYIRGIVSASYNHEIFTCDIYKYSIFTDLRNFMPWIINKIFED